MGRKISINRVEPVILEFEDGTTKTILLNNTALMILTEEFGDINRMFKELEKKPFELVSRLIYAGIKAVDTDFTYEEAEVIALNGGIELLEQLTDHLVEVFDGYCKDEELKKKVLKEAEATLHIGQKK
ncbi:hypothetical protein [Filifactor alocis]|uniref:hypothetical protein n=1 Tax=Filifactor alocis TaxID=143361 RepID=UPI0028E9BADA|nr:hypothetical protein [Filifactor alocis]